MRNKSHYLLHFYVHLFYISLKMHKKIRHLPTANLKAALNLYHSINIHNRRNDYCILCLYIVICHK